MIIGRLGGVSSDGKTICYDAETESVLQIPIPAFPIGTEIYRDESGNWRAVITENMTDDQKKRLLQSEAFYYQTKDWLPYRSYQRVCSLFPYSCASKFEENPYYLSKITFESGAPVANVCQIDSAVVLDTFAKRIQEMEAIISFVLEENERKGNTWIPYAQLQQRVKYILAKTGHPLLIGSVAAYLKYHNEIFYYEEDKVAFRSSYEREAMIYRIIKASLQNWYTFPAFHHQENEDLSVEQNHAVKHLIMEGGNFVIMTGGPGTGKTTTLGIIVDELLSSYPDVQIHLLAPTGRATKRIREVFGNREVSISTIHRFVGYGHRITKKERERIRNAGLIIIDESSMLDLEIFERFLSLVDLQHTKVILVGDVDQLPSIGAGNILADLIDLNVYTERLTANYRSHGSIIDNAHAINRGEIFLKEDENFRILSPAHCLQNLAAGLCTDADIVITPYKALMTEGNERTGSSGIINPILQKRYLGRPANGIQVGDNIIMTQTNYSVGYFNGETGVVLSKFPNGDYFVGFGDRELVIKNVDDMSLGYAITAHKSQGSEYPNGTICIPPFESFYTRRMLYTAVTRAKKKCVLIGDKEDIAKVILNNADAQRYTFLSTFEKFR